MKNGIASFFSWLFIPLLMPIYGLLIIMYYPVTSISFISLDSIFLYSEASKILFLLLFLVFGVLAPMVSLFVLLKNKTISSIKLRNWNERLTPIAIVTFYYFILFGFLFFQDKNLPIPPLLKGVSLGCGVALGMTYFLIKKRNISFHSMGVGTLFGMVYMYSLSLAIIPLYVLIGILLLGGIVGAIAVGYRKHSLYEVGLGYLLGCSSQIITIFAVQIISFYLLT